MVHHPTTGYRAVFTLAAVIIAGLVLTSPCAAEETGPNRLELKVALLPIFDALPFHVAASEGYFASDRVEIVGLPVGSGLERDQLLQAGETDGVLNEMATVAMFNRDGVKAKIVAVARHPAPGFPLFRILAAPGSGIAAAKDLAGVPIAVSTHTIIEYVTDRLLAQKGLKSDRVVKRSVPVIPERYQLLILGHIRAATLPDPMGKSAMAAGAVQILDDTQYPEYSVSVLTFSREALRGKGDAIRFFLKGWDRAAAAINDNPDAYRNLARKKTRIPRNIQDAYQIPPFPRKKVPSELQWADVQRWMMDKELLDAPVSYADSVTDAFLPQ